MHHWAGSSARHKQHTCFLTEELSLLRYDHQTSEWTMCELSEIDWAVPTNGLDGYQDACEIEEEDYDCYGMYDKDHLKDRKGKKEGKKKDKGKKEKKSGKSKDKKKKKDKVK